MAADFSRALERIPAQLRDRPGARFTVIINGTKKPEGKDWAGPNGANYSINDPQLAGYLSQGHNYGVLTGVGGLVVLDVDDLPRLEALGIISKLPDTFTVRTGRGGLHLYLNCPGLTDKIVLEDPELKDSEGDPLHLGELQATGQQVVGPGSRHPNGNFYEVIENRPIATINKDDLMLILAPVAHTEDEQHLEAEHARRRSSGGSSAGDLIPIDQVAWPKDVKERAGAEVRGSHPLHGSDSGKNFTVNTSKNCWHCFRHNTGGGPLEWLAVEAGLIRCEDAKPGCLSNGLFKKARGIARDRGFDIPDRQAAKAKADDVPDQPATEAKDDDDGPTVIDAIRALDSVCDGAISKDGSGFNKFDREEHSDLIDKAINEGTLTPKEEKRAYKLLKKYSKQLKSLDIKYEDIGHIARESGDAQSHEIEQEKFTDDIKTKALEVLQTGDPIQVVVDSCGRMVLGAERAFKKLICCVSVQNIRQSSGLHPKLSGNSGGGKTWTVYAFAHHLPKEAVVKGSMSAKAGFYHFDGDRVFRILDDYQAGNEDLDTVIKQTTSEFHEPFIHRTVIKQQPATLEIGSEQTWAITSIENDQDIQVLNRSIPINVDDSEDLTRCVNNHTIERYGKGESSKLLDDAVLICRAMFQILRDEGYIDVRVPFYDRIEWIDTSNRRNPSIFMDLVIAHTAMFRYQREKDSDGYYLSTEEDFRRALELFTDNDAEELVKRFTKKEREVIEFMISRPDGVTVNEIAERLNVSRPRAVRILAGERGKGGLSDKVTLLKNDLSETVTINDDERKTVHRTYYSIANYDRFTGFDAVVRLRPELSTDNDVPDVPHGVPHGVPHQTGDGKDGVMNVIDNRRERESGTGASSCGEENFSLSKISLKRYMIRLIAKTPVHHAVQRRYRTVHHLRR